MHWSERHGLSLTVNSKWSNDFRLWVGEFTIGYLILMKTDDSWLPPPQVVERGACILFGWHTLWQLGKSFNKQYKQQHIIQQNIIQHKQTNNNIMQDHAKTRVHIWSLKSNTKLSPRHPQWSRHYERLRKCLSKKRDFWVLFDAPFFLGKRYGVTTYFLYKKNKKKN